MPIETTRIKLVRQRIPREFPMSAINIVTLLLVIIGGINRLLVDLFEFDLVAAIFGGQTAALSRVVYILVGLSLSGS